MVVGMAKKCPLCKEDRTSLVANRVRFGRAADVRKCDVCGLLYLDQESCNFPADFYEAEYHQTYISHIEPSASDPGAYFEKMTKATKPWSERIGTLLSGKEVLLDFGCSAGHLLKSIEDKAGKVYGHEVNRKEIEFCRDRLGLDVSSEPLERRFSEGTFDLITLVFVLEHISEPAGLLKGLMKFLKPGGKIVVVVPNALDPLVGFYDIPAFREFYFCIEHLYYFTPATLASVFGLAGLKGTVEALQEYPITNHLNWGYRQKPSDVLASRRPVPDVPLRDETFMKRWEEFWIRIDDEYRRFLGEVGFSDRIWAVVSPDEALRF
jgi:2-polyprenyl-3-methyl-5-hydroxy-6-metoxy-1,4-benzoquinol methylase